MQFALLLICCLGATTLVESRRTASGASGSRHAVRSIAEGKVLVKGQCICTATKVAVSRIACGSSTGFIQPGQCFAFTGSVQLCGRFTQYSIAFLGGGYVFAKDMNMASQSRCGPSGSGTPSNRSLAAPRHPETKRPIHPSSNTNSGKSHSGSRHEVRYIDEGKVLVKGQCLCAANLLQPTANVAVSKSACGSPTGFIRPGLCFPFTGNIRFCGGYTQYSISFLGGGYVFGRDMILTSPHRCRPSGNGTDSNAPSSNKNSGISLSGNGDDNEYPIEGMNAFWSLACYVKRHDNNRIYENTFGLFDVDGDGKVSAAEILEFPFYSDWKLSDFEYLVKYFDENEDDALDLAEFSRIIENDCLVK